MRFFLIFSSKRSFTVAFFFIFIILIHKETYKDVWTDP